MEEADDWYEEQQEGLGADFSGEVDRALKVIGDGPEIWPRWPGSPRAPLVRRFVLTRFPYAIAYMTQLDRVVVIAVAHTRRRPGYWLHRLGRGR
jgi:plasmid stabilization system protein ParE